MKFDLATMREERTLKHSIVDAYCQWRKDDPTEKCQIFYRLRISVEFRLSSIQLMEEFDNR